MKTPLSAFGFFLLTQFPKQGGGDEKECWQHPLCAQRQTEGQAGVIRFHAHRNPIKWEVLAEGADGQAQQTHNICPAWS